MMMKWNSRMGLKQLVTTCLTIGCFWSYAVTHAGAEESQMGEDEASEGSEKLLVIMLDGFRWDYYDMYKKDLNAFEHFLSEGVQAEYLDPVFPPVSYPAWTTISTGVYPETHGIIGNYMFDLNISDPSKATFDIHDPATTTRVEWWQNSEPIWTTATRYGKKVFLRYWSRCDVPIREVKPHECTGYREARGIEAIRQTFNMAVRKLQQDFDLVMVYGEHLDTIGHKYGPNSAELRQALIDVDGLLNELLDQLLDSQLDEKVNVVILSDHGMTWTGEGSGVKYISLDEHLDKSEVYRALDKGAAMSIVPFARYFPSVYNRLKSVNGTTVYLREEIPEEWHYKNGRLVQDILVVAKDKHVIRSLQTSKQIPRDRDPQALWEGTHGYPDMEDMRAIFFAKGPAFKKGIVQPAIHMKDVYQIFTRILNVPAEPHNGTWSKVSGMLVNGVVHMEISAIVLCTLALLAISSHFVNIIIPSDNAL